MDSSNILAQSILLPYQLALLEDIISIADGMDCENRGSQEFKWSTQNLDHTINKLDGGNPDTPIAHQFDSNNHVRCRKLAWEMTSTQPPTAQIKTIDLGNGNILEVLLLENGAQRIEINAATQALERIGQHGNYLDSLSTQKAVFVPSRNLAYNTISVADFAKIVVREALLGEHCAIVLLGVFAEIGAESLFRNHSD